MINKMARSLIKTFSLQTLARLPFDIADALHQRKIDVRHPGSLSDLNLPLGNTANIATDRNQLVSVIKVEGAKQYVVTESHNNAIKTIFNALKGNLSRKITDYAWLHIHNNDEEACVALLEKSQQSCRNVSAIQGLRNSSFTDERIEVLKSVVQKEETYLCIWTDSKAGRNDGTESYRKTTSRGTCDLSKMGAHIRLANTHNETVRSTASALRSAGFHSVLLKNAEIGKLLADCVDPTFNKNLVPRLFGQVVAEHPNHLDEYTTLYKLRGHENLAQGLKGKDYNCVFPPKIGYQIFRRQPTYDGSHIIIGDKRYASVMVTLAPRDPSAFNILVHEAVRDRIPFRVSMHMKSNVSSLIAAKHTLASFLSLLPQDKNKRIRDALSQMRDFAKRMGTPLTLQVVFTTWAPSDDSRKLDQNIEKLSSMINLWGASQGTLMEDDGLFGFLSSMPPFRSRSASPICAGPADEILYLAPLTRPSLPWTEGALAFRSPTGKPLFFQPMSAIQAHHIYLVSGDPGFGKSLLCQLIILALAESIEMLPFIAITDVGSSSKGTIDYLRSILPAHKKHQVVYYNLQNSPQHAINFLDTPLGLRFPLADQFRYSRDLLLAGLADAQTGIVQEGFKEILGEAIQIAYEKCADSGPKSVAKTYEDSMTGDKYWRSDIAPALKRVGVIPTEETYVYTIVDLLFEAKEFRAATLIQRFAVPLLKDVTQAVLSPNMSGLAKKEVAPKYTLGEMLYDKLSAMEAEYKIFQLPTQLDLGDARIVAFNLADVCPSGTDISSAQIGSLFFGAASRLMVNRFFWNDERVKEIPEKYRAYHADVTRSVRRTPNMYFADEQQRFSNLPSAQAVPENIASEGRKLTIGVMLASQRPKEFSAKMRELSTARFFVGFSKDAIKGVCESFDLNDTEQWLLERINMPDHNGSTILAQFDTNQGSFSQLLNLRVGKRLLWGLSTKQLSSMVRDDVSNEFGYESALHILKKLYPSCEIESEYERRKVSLSQEIVTLSGLEDLSKRTQVDDIQQQITDDIISKGKEYFLESLEEIGYAN